MGRGISRTAAFVALWRALRAGHRGGPGLGARLAALPRMVGASLRRTRRYDGVRYDGLWRIGLMALAMVYLAWPIELLPELFLGPVGLIDDAVVVTWLAGAVLSETGRFLDWERRRAVAPAGQVPRQPREPDEPRELDEPRQLPDQPFHQPSQQPPHQPPKQPPDQLAGTGGAG